MFYASRFLTALSELEGPIIHQHKSEEDSMFAAVKQSKGEGLKPADAALSYFISQAQRGLQDDPDRWSPITRKAARQVRVWLQQEKVGKQSAKLLFDLLKKSTPDAA